MLNLKEVDYLQNITKDRFYNDYFKKQKPVVVKGFTKDWPAYSKWTLDSIKNIAGDVNVPLYDDRPVNYNEKFNEAHAEMKMADYIDLLKSEPTKYRIFLWNILKEIPSLKDDYRIPDLGVSIMKSLPMLFFGGENSHTFMHYDIDLANIFHFHFDGKKQAILYNQEQTKYMYKVPNSLITREDIDFDNPDLEKWPALKKAEGYIANLEHGDMLYMPEGFWHHMKYITPGMSMSLRAIARNPVNFSKAIYNVAIMRSVDNVMRMTIGEKWLSWKNSYAIERTKAYE